MSYINIWDRKKCILGQTELCWRRYMRAKQIRTDLHWAEIIHLCCRISMINAVRAFLDSAPYTLWYSAALQPLLFYVVPLSGDNVIAHGCSFMSQGLDGDLNYILTSKSKNISNSSPLGSSYELKPRLELRSAFPHKSSGSMPWSWFRINPIKSCWSWTRERLTIVGRASTKDHSLKGTIFKEK